MDPAPIFLCGAARSGTTLAVDMLGLHSQLSPVYETFFITHISQLLFERKEMSLAKLQTEVIAFMTDWTSSLPMRDIPGFKGEHERFHHGPNHLLFSRDFTMRATRRFLMELRAGRPRLDALRALCSALFAEHARLDGGKPLVVNKTPSYVEILPILSEMFPRSKVVHCVRDGRDVACSVLARPWGPQTVREAAQWWAAKAGRAAAWGAANADRYLELRYEDLLRRPRTELARLFDALGVADESMAILAHYDHQWPLEKCRAGAWRFLPRRELRAFGRGRAGELLRRFGYAAEEDEPFWSSGESDNQEELSQERTEQRNGDGHQTREAEGEINVTIAAGKVCHDSSEGVEGWSMGNSEELWPYEGTYDGSFWSSVSWWDEGWTEAGADAFAAGSETWYEGSWD